MRGRRLRAFDRDALDTGEPARLHAVAGSVIDDARRPQSPIENAREVGRTVLGLMLIAIGIVLLRHLLILAHRFLQ